MSSSNKQGVLVVAVIFAVAVGTIWYVSFGSSASSNFSEGLVTANGMYHGGKYQDGYEPPKQEKSLDSVQYTEGSQTAVLSVYSLFDFSDLSWMTN
jgi:hypothetical protein